MEPPKIAEKRQTKKYHEKKSQQGASQDGCDLGEMCRTAEDRDGFKTLIGGLFSQGTSMATV